MNQDTYKTRDLSEAAALLLQSQQLVKIERDKAVCWFVFENKDNCTKISNDFFFGSLMVNAREYHGAMGRLKNRIFAGT